MNEVMRRQILTQIVHLEMALYPYVNGVHKIADSTQISGFTESDNLFLQTFSPIYLQAMLGNTAALYQLCGVKSYPTPEDFNRIYEISLNGQGAVLAATEELIDSLMAQNVENVLWSGDSLKYIN